MNFLTKNRILVIVVVILSLLLLSILGGLGYGYYRSKQASKLPPPANRFEHQAAFISRSLNFSPIQNEQFIRLGEGFHFKFDSLATQIRLVSGEINNEITRAEVDTLKLNMLIDRYANLQRQLKELSVRHLMEVRALCNPGQQQQFGRMARQINRRHQQMNRNNSNDRMRGMPPRGHQNQNNF